MSSTTSSDNGLQEPGDSEYDFQSAQSIQAADREYQRLSKQESDSEEADLLPLPPNLTQHDSDSDEYIPSPAKPQRRGKGKGKGKRKEHINDEQGAAHDLSSPKEILPETEPRYDRPNRFTGAPSTWLSWTKSERQTIKSLDQERATDLSANLYVAHRIKGDAQEKTRRAKLRREKRRADHPTKDKGERRSSEEKSFMPPKIWTAWPMPPEQVPRVFHTTGILDEDDPFTIKGPRDLRPSAELEECLIATITRAARERWRERQWEGEVDEASDASVQSSQHDSVRPPCPQKQRDSSSPPMLFSSQPIASSQSRPPPRSFATSRLYSASPPQASLRPVPLADNDRARTLLQPPTRRIISQLDDLLLGLHRARKSYAGGHGSRDESSTQTETSAERSNSRSRGRKRRAESQRKTSSRIDLATDDTEAARMNEEHDEERRMSRSSHSRARIRSGTSTSTSREPNVSRLGLRDWSDVLGMAALTGWDRDVVLRAGERCAGLFEEDMGFRTFHLSSRAGGKVREEWLASGQQGSGQRGDEEDSRTVQGYDAEVMETEDEEGGSECLSTTAPPSSAGEGEDDNFNSSASSSASPSSAADTQSGTSSRISFFPCPHPPCHHHLLSPFRTKENLARHLKRQHLPLKQAHQPQPPETEAEAELAAEGIYCPVPTCNRHTDPFSRGNLLYKHIRRVHPEVDLRGVKEGEKRRRSVSRGLRKRRSRKMTEEGVGG